LRDIRPAHRDGNGERRRADFRVTVSLALP
jgi:hypothetical protein